MEASQAKDWRRKPQAEGTAGGKALTLERLGMFDMANGADAF